MMQPVLTFLCRQLQFPQTAIRSLAERSLHSLRAPQQLALGCVTDLTSPLSKATPSVLLATSANPYRHLPLLGGLRSFRHTSLNGSIPTSHSRVSTLNSPRRSFHSQLWPSRFPLNFTNCIIGVNVAAFIGQHLTNDRLTGKFMKSSWHIEKGEWWRLITPVFLHGDFMHLLINSYSLYNLGNSLEPIAGLQRFAVFYFVSAVAGNLFSHWYNRNNSVGASTALFGILGAEAMMYWRNRNVLVNSQSNLQNIALMLAINMAYGFSNSRIDNSGHFGGLLGGLIASYLLGPAFVRGRWGGYQDKPPINIFGSK